MALLSFSNAISQNKEIPLSSLQTMQDSLTQYRVQFLSSKKIDNRHFKDAYKSSGDCLIVQTESGLYHYMIIPKTNTLQAAQDILYFVQYDFPDAFIVYYYNGKRFN